MRELEGEYKLGHMLCASRNPNFLLNVISACVEEEREDTQRESSVDNLKWLPHIIQQDPDILQVIHRDSFHFHVWLNDSGLTDNFSLPIVCGVRDQRRRERREEEDSIHLVSSRQATRKICIRYHPILVVRNEQQVRHHTIM